MNKYVRTKDGKIVKIDLEDNRVFTSKYEVVGFPKETIEELCDHLVIVEKGSSFLPHIQHRFLGDLFLNHSYDEKFQQNKLIVYGAIWTSKGLKYVAKMNKEGELELICD